MGYGYGHGKVGMIILVLIAAVVLLLWVAGKKDNPLYKFGIIMAWIIFIISAVMFVGKVGKCAYNYKTYGCRMMGGGMGMMKGGMKGRGMGRGMMQQPADQ